MESPGEFLNRIIATTIHFLIIIWLSRWFMVAHILPAETKVAANIATAIATIIILLVFFLRAAPFFGMG